MQCYEIDGLVPVVDPEAFVHPSAILVADVIIGPRCYIGPAACLRGDFGRIIVEAGANVQDTCVMHGFPGTDTVIGPDGHIGHGAIIHGARIEENAMVGMNAIVLDGAVVGESAIVGALALVGENQVIPPRSLAVGAPAKVIRELTDDEIAWKRMGTADYVELARLSSTEMRKVEPLRAAEANRPRMRRGDSTSLAVFRAGRKAAG